MTDDAIIRGFAFPRALHYHAETMTWYRPEADGAVTIGLSALALASAGEILVFAARPLGAAIEPGRAIGNVETAKTVSSVRTMVGGRIAAVNDAVERNGELIGRDPYAAWLVRLDPAAWARDRTALATGDAAVAAIEAQMRLYRIESPGGAP